MIGMIKEIVSETIYNECNVSLHGFWKYSLFVKGDFSGAESEEASG